MSLIKWLLVAAIVLSAAVLSNAQCCCSGVGFTLLDKHNTPIAPDKLTIKDITPNTLSRQLSLAYAPEVYYKLYCASGNEVVAVTYKGKEMRLHFKFYGDFGSGRGSFQFAPGDYFVDPTERTGQSPNLGMKLRKAKPGELKASD